MDSGLSDDEKESLKKDGIVTYSDENSDLSRQVMLNTMSHFSNQIAAIKPGQENRSVSLMHEVACEALANSIFGFMVVFEDKGMPELTEKEIDRCFKWIRHRAQVLYDRKKNQENDEKNDFRGTNNLERQ